MSYTIPIQYIHTYTYIYIYIRICIYAISSNHIMWYNVAKPNVINHHNFATFVYGWDFRHPPPTPFANDQPSNMVVKS